MSLSTASVTFPHSPHRLLGSALGTAGGMAGAPGLQERDVALPAGSAAGTVPSEPDHPEQRGL